MAARPRRAPLRRRLVMIAGRSACEAASVRRSYRAQIREIHVDHETARIAGLEGIEELPPRVERGYRMPGGPQRQGKRIPHCVVLIDEENRAAPRRGGACRVRLGRQSGLLAWGSKGFRRNDRGTKRPSLTSDDGGRHPMNPVYEVLPTPAGNEMSGGGRVDAAANAMRTSCDRLSARIFSMTRARWISTVRGLIASSRAIALLDRPITSCSRTSCSRA